MALDANTRPWELEEFRADELEALFIEKATRDARGGDW